MATRPKPSVRNAPKGSRKRTGVRPDAENPATFIRDSIIFMRQLKDPAFRLYCIMRAHVWETEDHRTVAITSAALEEMMERSRSSVYRYMQNLRECGLIGLHEQRVWWVYNGVSRSTERRTANVYTVYDIPPDDYTGPRTVKDVKALVHEAAKDGRGPRPGDRVRVVSAGQPVRVIEHYNPYGPNELVDAPGDVPDTGLPGMDDRLPGADAWDHDPDAGPLAADPTEGAGAARGAEPAGADPAPADADDPAPAASDDTGTTVTGPGADAFGIPRQSDVLPDQGGCSNLTHAASKNDTPIKNAAQDWGGKEGTRGRAGVSVTGDFDPATSAESWGLVAELARAVMSRGEALTVDEHERLAMACDNARRAVERCPGLSWDAYVRWLWTGWRHEDGRPRFTSFVGVLFHRFDPVTVMTKAWRDAGVFERERPSDDAWGTATADPLRLTCERHGDDVPVAADGRCAVCEAEADAESASAAADAALPEGWGEQPEPTAEEVTESFMAAGGSEINADGPKPGSRPRDYNPVVRATWERLGAALGRDLLGSR